MFGLKILRTIIKPKYIIPILLLIIIIESYFLIRPRARKPQGIQQKVADEACWEASAQMDKKLEKYFGKKIVITRFKNDPSYYITEKMKEIFVKKGNFQIQEETYIDNLLNKIEVDETQSKFASDIINKLRSIGADILITGNVKEFRSTENKAIITLSLKAQNIKENKEIATIEITRKRYSGPFGKSWNSFVFRCIAWFLIIILLPVTFIVPLRNLIEIDSNAMKAVILIFYGLLGMTLGILLIGHMGPTWWGWLTVIVTFITSFIYVWWFSSRLVE